MILVDSSVWIDFFNGNYNTYVKKLESILFDKQIIIGDLIKIEVLQGFKSDKDYKIAKRLLERVDSVSLVTPITTELSISIHRKLRQKGITIRKTIDTIIASYCIVNQIPLLTKDKDFKYFSEHFLLKLL